MQQHERLGRLMRIAMLGAMAFLLMYFGEFHVPPFAEFLKYDPGDVPAMIAAYTMGPVAGVVVQLIKVLLFWVSGKATTGLVGVAANFLAGAALVVAAGLTHGLLQRAGARNWFWNLLTASAGAVVMSAVLIPFLAVLIYPLWGMQGAAAWNAALYISTPFNLFKGFVSCAISALFYQRLQAFLVGSQRAA